VVPVQFGFYMNVELQNVYETRYNKQGEKVYDQGHPYFNIFYSEQYKYFWSVCQEYEYILDMDENHMFVWRKHVKRSL
jgi:hypothetical protein